MAGFQKATRERAKLRLALAGPAGSGKTYTALAVATALVGSGRVAVVDTEHGSASKYADLFDFDTLELQTFHPQKFIDAITDAEQAGYGAIILDSLSHAWMGKEGTLDLVDRAAKRSQSGNSFTAWKDVTPIQNALIDRMLSANLHVIATLRVKTEYVIVENEKGKKEPKKVGLQPIQRDQVEYEFDVYGDLDQDNNLIIGKSRCSALAGQVIAKPGKQLAKVLVDWLGGAAPSTSNGMNRAAAATQPAQPAARASANGQRTGSQDQTRQAERCGEIFGSDDNSTAFADQPTVPSSSAQAEPVAEDRVEVLTAYRDLYRKARKQLGKAFIEADWTPAADATIEELEAKGVALGELMNAQLAPF